jgi:L-arabinonolactonase
MQPNVIVDRQFELGECTIWCERLQSVYWTDIYAATLWRFTPSGSTPDAKGSLRSWPMPERLCTFALTGDDDRLLLGLASRLAWISLSSGRVTPICNIEAHLPSTRLNDGRCDRQGRYIFSTMNEAPDRAPIGSIYRLGADMRVERLPLPGVSIPNSICFSPDGRRMYHCDTPTNIIWYSDYDSASGVLGGQYLFADLRGVAPGSPDGSTVDSQGHVWNAQWGGARVVRYAPDGRIERQIALPVTQPSCPALGGAALDRLYVTTAYEHLTPAMQQRQPLAGSLFGIDQPGIRGLPEVRFSGVF